MFYIHMLRTKKYKKVKFLNEFDSKVYVKGFAKKPLIYLDSTNKIALYTSDFNELEEYHRGILIDLYHDYTRRVSKFG